MNRHQQPRSISTVGAFLGALPGEKYHAVRNPSKSLFFRLQRKVFQQLQIGSGDVVRGIGVAGDCLLECLLKHSSAQRFAFFVEPELPRGDAAIKALGDRGITRQGLSVDSRAALLNGGLEAIAPDAWLDVYGTAIEAFSLRNHFALRCYPIVTLQHAFSPHHLLGERFLRLILMKGYPCDSVLCTSSAGKKGIQNLLSSLSERIEKDFGIRTAFRGRVDSIPLCVDTDLYRPSDKAKLRKNLRLPANSVLLVYIGYIAPMKSDLVPLLHVLQRLIRENPTQNVTLTLIGTGWPQYQNVLLERARQLGIQRHVVILNNVSDEIKRQALAAADIFVSPSDTAQEAFGLTPVEAMASGVPQVVSDWNGYRDTVRNGETGFRIPTFWTTSDEELVGTGDLLGWRYDHMVLGQSLAIDLGALFHALQDLVRNHDLRHRMAITSREVAVREYSYAAIARKYDELWAELSEESREVSCLDTAPVYDQPFYSKMLGHYTTHNIADDVLLSIGEWAQDITMVDTQSANAWSRPVLDEVILKDIMAVVRGKSQTDVFTLESLLAEVGKGRPNVIRRHVLWLLKYGCLRVAGQR